MADAALAKQLEALASPVRMEILHALRVPQRVGTLRITATRNRRGEHEGRVLARQTVQHHVDALETAGLVVRLLDEDAADRFVLNHPQLFALVDQVRGLAKLRSAHAPDGPTVLESLVSQPQPPPGPRLLLAYGRDDHTAFPLHPGSLWRIGRGKDNDIVLDYDPFSSSEHAVIRRTKAGFSIEDLASRNGTFLDWDGLPAHQPQPLASGSVLQLGKTVLVFQEGVP